MDSEEPQQPRSAEIQQKERRKGIMILEIGVLLIFILILLGLVMACIPKAYVRPGKAKIVLALTDIAALCVGLEAFKQDTGHYPTQEEGLEALIRAPKGNKDWSGPYYAGRRIPADPWGRHYVYVCPGKHNAVGYDLHSLGPSGKDGAEDNIDNWSRR
jgi:general secretion pathway protein G